MLNDILTLLTPNHREDGFFVNSETTLRDMIQFGMTWSCYQIYVKEEGEDNANVLMANYERESVIIYLITENSVLSNHFLNFLFFFFSLLEIFSNGKPAEDIHFTRRTKYFLLMGRKL